MANLSFDINNSKDFFVKLLEDYEDFKIDKTSSRKALNCSMTAWHLIDWLFEEYKSQHGFKSIGYFRETLYPQCPSLKIMHDLANGTKHFNIDRPKDSIKETKKHLGAFSQAFSRSFNITTLKIEFQDGTVLYFEDEIKKVVDFWTQYLEINYDIKIDAK